MNYRDTLDNLLKQVDDEWLTDLTARYVAAAYRQLEWWRNALAPRVSEERQRSLETPQWAIYTGRTRTTYGGRSNNPYDYYASEAQARKDSLIGRSLPPLLVGRLAMLARSEEPRAPLGVKGKEARDANKALERLELVRRSADTVRPTRWGRVVADALAPRS